MLNKTPLLHQSFGPCVLLSLSLSVSVSLSLSGWSPGAQRPSEFTFLLGLLRPSREGALCLHPIKRAPEASMNRASPVSGTLLAFCVNQGISASFSPLYSLFCWCRSYWGYPWILLGLDPGSHQIQVDRNYIRYLFWTQSYETTYQKE